MTDDVMTADEARALLADVAPRQVCAMCGAVDPPTVRDTIGGDAVDLHDGCSDVVRGRVDLTYGMLRHEDALRALRSVVALHGRLEAHQRPQATPDGGGEPRGDGAPARGLPVATDGGVLDLTDEVRALAYCPDGHYWRPGVGVELVEDIGDDSLPLRVRRVVSLCPRCGFDWTLSSEAM